MANSTSSNDTSALRALNAARNDEKGTLETAAGNILSKAGTDVWRKVERDPENYVLNRDEFAIFNYYRGHYEKTPANVPIVQKAVARFWNNYRGEGSAPTPNSASSAGKA